MAIQKHLNQNERLTIEHSLNDRLSFKAIGRELNRDCTTISKEVKIHRVFKKTGSLVAHLITVYIALNVTSAIYVMYVVQVATNTAVSAGIALLTAYFISHSYAHFLTDLPMYATVVKNCLVVPLKKLSIMQFPLKRNIRISFLNPEKELISLKMKLHIWNKSSAH